MIQSIRIRWEDSVASDTSASEEESTQCPRCQGLMVPDQFFDLINDDWSWRFDGWRCLCCGNILDPVIIRNQQALMVKGAGNAFLAGEGHEATLGQDWEILAYGS